MYCIYIRFNGRLIKHSYIIFTSVIKIMFTISYHDSYSCFCSPIVPNIGSNERWRRCATYFNFIVIMDIIDNFPILKRKC